MMGKSMDLQGLRKRFKSNEESLKARVLKRFLVAPEGGKPRAIDDGKSSQSNEATCMVETIALPTCAFPAAVAAEFRTAEIEQRLRTGRLADGDVVVSPPLVLGLEDAENAYRHIPCAQPQYTVIALWSPKHGEVRYYEVYGHNFGLKSSVVNFSRIPALMVRAAALILAISVTSYVDDYIVVDVRAGGASAQAGLVSLHKSLRLLTISAAKHKAPSAVNTVLGVRCDLSAAHDRGGPRVTMTPTRKRIARTLTRLHACKNRGVMLPAEAASLVGKLAFTLTSLYARVGRALLAPLRNRQYERLSFTAWTPAMSKMLAALEVILLGCDKMRRTIHIGEADRGHVVIYSDVAYAAGVTHRLGLVVVDTASGERAFASAEPPQWILQMFPAEFMICQLETLAALCAQLTFSQAVRGRRVVHYIDNTAALAAIVHGYSRHGDMAEMANMYHLAVAANNADVWHEWVPSAANIADVPTKKEHAQWHLLAGMQQVAMVFPEESMWAHPSFMAPAGARTWEDIIASEGADAWVAGEI